MINYEKEITFDDTGIDFENYDLDELVNETYKETHPVGYQIVVRIYKPKSVVKTKGGIILTNTSINKEHQDHKFTNSVGLVVKMATGCYKDEERYRFTGPYCKVGDWVLFPRASAYTYENKGITSATIVEDRIVLVVDDPRVIKRISCD